MERKMSISFIQHRTLTAAATLLLTCLSLCSCENFLREDPKDKISQDEAYPDAYHLYLGTVVSLYSNIGGNAPSQGIQGTYRGIYDYNTFTTDEAMIPTRGGDWYDGGFWQRLYLHTWTEYEGGLQDTWEYLYKVIVLCNKSIAALQETSLIEGKQKEEYIAEVRGLRAMYYFYLMDMFGRVPIITDPEATMTTVKQNSRSEVFSFVTGELQEILPLLSESKSIVQGDFYGRITRDVAVFLLAKIYLNAGVYNDDNTADGKIPDGGKMIFSIEGTKMNAWEACLHYCMQLDDVYRLDPFYEDPFQVYNENSSENIFTIPSGRDLPQTEFQYLFRSRHYYHGAAFGWAAENGSCATSYALSVYGYESVDNPGKDIDLRFDVNYYWGEVKDLEGNTIKVGDGSPLVYYPEKATLDLSGSQWEKTAGARMRKYEVDPNALSDGKIQSNDIVLFRYADVLLMEAEALVRNGKNGNGPFNMVRSRAFSSEREATLDNILDERLMEFAWEGWRRNDLVRFGKFTRSYSDRPALEGEESGYTTVFPIPGNVILYNTSMTQNPGY
ncbi:MAG: RagB/SusD family nutrient uptake outer membrane protein [Bacteroidales bacterium]|nr:RagB/SusD family nutrient uptake outer membrane protein [Bacteroidales bacterium]